MMVAPIPRLYRLSLNSMDPESLIGHGLVSGVCSPLRVEHSLNEVGRQIGCNPSSVMRWRDAHRQGGVDALQVRFSPGRPLKLAEGKRKRLVRLLLKGPMAQGYRTNLWTTPRIADMVEREFGVRYHPDHIGRLMHSLGWTPQKPERRALERNEVEIERWKQEEWPRIKKTLQGWVPISSLQTNRASC
jgi:transposase